MSDQSTEYKKYDHATSLSNQVERLNEQIVKGLEQSEHDDYGNYLDSIIMGLMTIERFYLRPFNNEDYSEFSDPDILKYSNKQKIQYITDAQKKLAELLDSQVLFFAKFTKEELGSVDKQAEEKDK